MSKQHVKILRHYTTSNGCAGVVYEVGGRRAATFVPGAADVLEWLLGSLGLKAEVAMDMPELVGSDAEVATAIEVRAKVVQWIAKRRAEDIQDAEVFGVTAGVIGRYWDLIERWAREQNSASWWAKERRQPLMIVQRWEMEAPGYEGKIDAAWGDLRAAAADVRPGDRRETKALATLAKYGGPEEVAKAKSYLASMKEK